MLREIRLESTVTLHYGGRVHVVGPATNSSGPWHSEGFASGCRLMLQRQGSTRRVTARLGSSSTMRSGSCAIWRASTGRRAKREMQQGWERSRAADRERRAAAAELRDAVREAAEDGTSKAEIARVAGP